MNSVKFPGVTEFRRLYKQPCLQDMTKAHFLCVYLYMHQCNKQAFYLSECMLVSQLFYWIWCLSFLVLPLLEFSIHLVSARWRLSFQCYRSTFCHREPCVLSMEFWSSKKCISSNNLTIFVMRGYFTQTTLTATITPTTLTKLRWLHWYVEQSKDKQLNINQSFTCSFLCLFIVYSRW